MYIRNAWDMARCMLDGNARSLEPGVIAAFYHRTQHELTPPDWKKREMAIGPLQTRNHNSDLDIVRKPIADTTLDDSSARKALFNPSPFPPSTPLQFHRNIIPTAISSPSAEARAANRNRRDPFQLPSIRSNFLRPGVQLAP